MWVSFDNGRSIGKLGSENGIILRDEEHPDGARMTLERGRNQPFSITCGIYGWLVHTRFFSSEDEAVTAFEKMKGELATILALIPDENDPEMEAKVRVVKEEISNFVRLFP